jgi:hypothetical protein
MSLEAFHNSQLQQFGTGYLKTESKGNWPSARPDINILLRASNLRVLHVNELHGFILNTTALHVPL